MSKAHIIGLLLVGVGLLVGSILLRVFSEGKYEIKAIDIVFIVIPLLFAGIATGKLRGFDLFGVKADLSDLWAKAAGTEIEQQVANMPVSPVEGAVEMVRMAEKRGTHEIPKLIEQKTQALSFRLGMGGYYAPAIKKYFDDLYGSSYLKYVVINHPDGTLFGMYNAADLIAYLRTLGEDGYQAFQHELNRGNQRAKQWLARLPGFVSSEKAVTAKTSKRDALQAMEKFKLDSLPVRDGKDRFVGTVERAKLTTSLILTVTQKLSGEPVPAGN
jgi:CBS domain-containing protein